MLIFTNIYIYIYRKKGNKKIEIYLIEKRRVELVGGLGSGTRGVSTQ